MILAKAVMEEETKPVSSVKTTWSFLVPQTLDLVVANQDSLSQKITSVRSAWTSAMHAWTNQAVRHAARATILNQEAASQIPYAHLTSTKRV